MRGKGTLDPGKNPNAYPMTDALQNPSALRIFVNGVSAGTFDLPDDPADHRGILSWLAQPRDKRLYEAGTYGYLIQASLPARALVQDRELLIRLEVDDSLSGGLAIYGEHFGRYPLGPTLVFELHE